MPRAGFEPARVSPYAPQTYVSTNSTTSALIHFITFLFISLIETSEPKFAFLKITLDPRISALAESVTAAYGESGAYIYNPSLLSTVKSFVALNYAHHWEGISLYNFQAAKKFRNVSFGIDVRHFIFVDTRYDIYLRPQGELSHRYGVFTGCFSAKDRNFAIGMNVKYVYQLIEHGHEFADQLVLFDLGLIYMELVEAPRRRIRIIKPEVKSSFGISVLNLSANPATVPMTLKLGGRMIGRGFKMYLDISKSSNRPFQIAAGSEWEIHKLSLLAGLKYELERDFNVACGFSYEHKGVSISYALVPHFNLGLSHRLGFRFSF